MKNRTGSGVTRPLLTPLALTDRERLAAGWTAARPQYHSVAGNPIGNSVNGCSVLPGVPRITNA